MRTGILNILQTSIKFIILHLAFIISSPAGMPQPGVVYYGQASDEYGWPYSQDAVAVLKVDGREVDRYTIDGDISPGVNFSLHAFVDDGDGTLFHEQATLQGDDVEIIIRVGGVDMAIISGVDVPVVSAPGDTHRIWVTAGTDSAGDGVSDAWKEELASLSGGRYATGADVIMHEDLDGDGMSNMQEYLSGTLAFYAEDFLGFEHVIQMMGDRLLLDFFTVPGKVYRLVGSEQPGHDMVMAERSWSFTMDGTLQAEIFSGTGNLMELYTQPETNRQVYGISVE